MGAEIELFNPQVKDPEKFYNFNYEDNKPEYKHAVRISGPSSLHNAVINISDLRAGATLVLAALAAGGESIIFEWNIWIGDTRNLRKDLGLLAQTLKEMRSN